MCFVLRLFDIFIAKKKKEFNVILCEQLQFYFRKAFKVTWALPSSLQACYYYVVAFFSIPATSSYFFNHNFPPFLRFSNINDSLCISYFLQGFKGTRKKPIKNPFVAEGALNPDYRYYTYYFIRSMSVRYDWNAWFMSGPS